MIEEITKPDVVDLIIQAETVGFETEEEALIFVKAVVEEGVTSALPGHLGHNARRVYNEYNLSERKWKS